MAEQFAGIISDTHGLLRPEALSMLKGSSCIIHAGDIGCPEVLAALKELAPLFAIKGNIDNQAWAADLPDEKAVEVFGYQAYLIHNLKTLNFDPQGQFDIVISGHSHVPKIFNKDGVLYFNPGSAGPRRFKLPVTIGRLWLSDGVPVGKITEL